MNFVNAALAFAAFVSGAAAQLTILSPGGPDLWWVDHSANDITWTCATSPYQNFTVLLDNTNSSILDAPYAFVAQQANYDCSEQISPYQMTTFPPATGYTIVFSNSLNSSDIYATSKPFEIKALGAAYPASSATPTGTGSATASGASSSASASASTTGAAAAASSSASTKKSGANRVTGSLGSLAAVAAALGIALV